MSNACATWILRFLNSWFPHEYPEDMRDGKKSMLIDGFMTKYAGYDDSMVMEVYQEFLSESPYAPKVAEVLKRLKDKKEYLSRIDHEVNPKIRTPEDKFEHCVRDGVRYRMEFVENYQTINGISYDGVKLVPIGKV